MLEDEEKAEELCAFSSHTSFHNVSTFTTLPRIVRSNTQFKNPSLLVGRQTPPFRQTGRHAILFPLTGRQTPPSLLQNDRFFPSPWLEDTPSPHWREAGWWPWGGYRGGGRGISLRGGGISSLTSSSKIIGFWCIWSDRWTHLPAHIHQNPIILEEEARRDEREEQRREWNTLWFSFKDAIFTYYTI